MLLIHLCILGKYRDRGMLGGGKDILIKSPFSKDQC